MLSTTASQYIQAINANYPVAGQNNDSQGFRDNFTNIKAALSATNAELVGLQVNSLSKSQDNDFGGFAIKNVNLVNASTPISKITDGTVNLDYTIANFWPIILPNSGINKINIVNMPEAQRSGSMLISVTAGSLYTQVLFTATTGTVVSIGPGQQPFSLPNGLPYLFELWNDYTTNDPVIYVKKLSEDIAEAAYLNSIVNATTYTGSIAIFDRSLRIGNLTLTTGTVNGSYDATVVTDGTHYGNIALVPNTVVTEITNIPVSPPGGMTNQVRVFNPLGIQPGSTVYFAGTNTSYIVDHVNGSTVYTTNQYNVRWTQIGQVITFINPQFTDYQPTVMQFSNTPSLDRYGTVTPGAARNLKGTVYANSNRLQVTYNNPDGISPNTFDINLSTTTTNTTLNDVATVGFMHSLLPAGSVIMWYGNQFALPYGWVICNGATAPNGVATPDLRNQFVIGAVSDFAFGSSSIPATEVTGVQTTSGGTSTSIIVAHSHVGTGTTFAVSDPGHQHASVGANQKSGATPNPNGPYGNAPVGSQWWGFDEFTAANAVQWYTSKEYTFQDQQGSTPLGGGVKLQTNITIESTGTDSGAYANLPPYMALYYIYKWIG
jgi:hypothetical protein